jgi:hypothetical protein
MFVLLVHASRLPAVLDGAPNLNRPDLSAVPLASSGKTFIPENSPDDTPL